MPHPDLLGLGVVGGVVFVVALDVLGGDIDAGTDFAVDQEGSLDLLGDLLAVALHRQALAGESGLEPLVIEVALGFDAVDVVVDVGFFGFEPLGLDFFVDQLVHNEHVKNVALGHAGDPFLR